MDAALRQFYQQTFVPALEKATGRTVEIDSLLPETPAARYLQYHYIAKNPFPIARKGRHAARRRRVRLQPRARSVPSDVAAPDPDLRVRRYLPHRHRDRRDRLYGRQARRTSRPASPTVATRARISEICSGACSARPIAARWRSRTSSAICRSLDAPRAFIGAPVFDGGRAIAVLVLRLSPDAIDRVMTSGQQWERDGLGKTGEAYLVGPDFLMRSNSRFLIESPELYAEQLTKSGMPRGEVATILREKSSILYQKVRSEAAEQALQGDEGTGVAHRLSRRRGAGLVGAAARLPGSNGASSRRSTATKRSCRCSTSPATR